MSPSGPVSWVLSSPSAVTGARLADGGRTLLVDAQVPSGGPHACFRGLKAVLTDPVEKDLVRVQVTFSSPSDRLPGCDKEHVATARVELPVRLGNRKVVVNYDTQFTAAGAKPPALRLCGRLGCTPPATGCTTASYEQALIAVDAPTHAYRDSENCDGKWLVMDFSWGTGPVCGDSTASPSGCSSRLGERWFLRA